jgi:LuxR family maltose regulon positive regulatory protein
VAHDPSRAASDPPAGGWDELRKGRWESARGLFERALGGAETPEALEGLSWAAWWLDDGEAVFPAYEYLLVVGRKARR